MLLNEEYILYLFHKEKLSLQSYRFIIYLLSITYKETKRIENKKIKEMSFDTDITESQISETQKSLIEKDVILVMNNDKYLNLKFFTKDTILLNYTFVTRLIKERKLKPSDYRLMLYFLSIADSKSKIIKKNKLSEISKVTGISEPQISLNVKLLIKNSIIYLKDSKRYFTENLFANKNSEK